MHSFPKRKRATAIVEHADGILVVLMRYMASSLPGGGVKPGETDEQAVIRELYEETGLIAVETVFLFRHESTARDHAVYWVRAAGVPEACGEIDQVAYYQEGAALKLSPESRKIVERFLAYKAQHPEHFLAHAVVAV
jgi:8-oxo-dGTP pyrophosphatase MutT (NUDIX family)